MKYHMTTCTQPNSITLNRDLRFSSRPELKPSAEKLRIQTKALGDPQTQPQLQNIVTQILPHTVVDLESFKQLAKKYVLTGESRNTICVQNAQVGFIRF